MYADRTAVSGSSERSIKDRLGSTRTSIKDRLGSSNLSRSVSGQDHHHHHHNQAILKRQRQDDVKRDHDLSAETKHPIKRAVPQNLRVTVLQDNIIPGISKNVVQSGLSKVSEKMLPMVKTQQPNGSLSCMSYVQGRSGAELFSAKKPSAELVSAKKPSAELVSAKKPSAKLVSAKKPSAELVSAKKPSAELVSAKKPAAQAAATPGIVGQKKQGVADGMTVASLLQSLGLSKYAITFQAEEVDMFALKHMNDDDLKAIGLPMGPRKKILLSLASVKGSR